MSAYSDFMGGYISEEEYKMDIAYEARRDEYLTLRQMELDALKDACMECEHHNDETGECEYGFDFKDCPELGDDGMP